MSGHKDDGTLVWSHRFIDMGDNVVVESRAGLEVLANSVNTNSLELGTI